jgi:hypothetical protein
MLIVRFKIDVDPMQRTWPVTLFEDVRKNIAY